MADNSIIQTGTVAGSAIDGTGITNLQAKANWDMKDINFYIETAATQSNILEQAIS
jgi:hypothetical protein